MAQDRIAYRTDLWPEIPYSLFMYAAHRYLGGAGDVRLTNDLDRVIVTLAGKPSWVVSEAAHDDHAKRWFEIYADDNHIDVITRRQDDYTNAIADGFFETIVRCWKMKREDVR